MLKTKVNLNGAKTVSYLGDRLGTAGAAKMDLEINAELNSEWRVESTHSRVEVLHWHQLR